MRKFIVIWIGELVSNIGSGMTAFALAVYIYQLTGSVTWVSIIALLSYLPAVILNPIGGILADRYDRRLMMICGDFFSALGLIYILISIKTGYYNIAPIAIGVTINSIFVSLLDPSYKATITDLLTEDEYAKASGLVQLAGNAKYLISPVIAGIILGFSNIKTILIIDILTFFITVIAIISVRRDIRKVNFKNNKFNFLNELKQGLKYIVMNKGVLTLVLLLAFICFFIGIVQTLIIPMMLSIGTAKSAGFLESIGAIGMLISSIVIGILGINKNFVNILRTALICCGIFIGLMGVSTYFIFIMIACVLFFATLPFVNTCADVLIRVSIPNEVQGRVWGHIGFLTQIGYVISYAVCGVMADKIFEPLMQNDGLLAGSIGRIIGTGDGRGVGLMLIVSGLLIIIIAITIGNRESIKGIEVSNFEYKL